MRKMGVGLLPLAIVFAVVLQFDAMAECDGFSHGSCIDYGCNYGSTECTCSYCEADPSASGLCNTAVNPTQCYIGPDKDKNPSYVEGDACTKCVLSDPGDGGGDPGGGDPGGGGGGGDPGPDNEDDPGCGWWEWWC